jgi:uncharacterized SAM-dependent methyltransferase
MSSVVHVAIHSSQSPEKIRRDLLASLRSRRVNHKFHYDSVKQTHQWLGLHQAYSPSRQDRDCAATYDRAFVATAEQIESRSVHVIGLGCGGGQKDTRLLKLLQARRKTVSYTPSDVSVAMTLVAHAAARKVLPAERITPLVGDLVTAADLPVVVGDVARQRAARLFTFFGMIPNFEPAGILPKLAALVRRQDVLLFSANLSPGPDYAAGMQKILPQYDNELTRAWLRTFLLDLGVERGDGQVRFAIEPRPGGVMRVVAAFEFRRGRRIRVDGEEFVFRHGDRIRLFFSYRYTPELVRRHLARYGLRVEQQWLTRSAEEGVFQVRRS